MPLSYISPLFKEGTVLTLDAVEILWVFKSNQGTQDSRGNQKNATQGHRPDTKNRRT